MNLQSILQVVTPIANILNVLVIAVGYFFLIKLYREWIGQSRESRTAGGRPQVVVSADYSHLPEVNIVVCNFTDAPAKDVSFEFSAPVEVPDGLVISDLPYLERGLPFLEPGGRISRPWGRLPDLAPMLKEKGLEGGIKVTTRYEDLAGGSPTRPNGPSTRSSSRAAGYRTPWAWTTSSRPWKGSPGAAARPAATAAPRSREPRSMTKGVSSKEDACPAAHHAEQLDHEGGP